MVEVDSGGDADGKAAVPVADGGTRGVRYTVRYLWRELPDDMRREVDSLDEESWEETDLMQCLVACSLAFALPPRPTHAS